VTTRLIFCIQLSKGKKVYNVIDFGDQLGAHYFQAKAYYGDNFIFRWHVVETSGMAEIGQSLENGELKFYDNFDDATKDMIDIDLIHSAGTLQCIPSPIEYLSKLLNLNAKNLLLHRMGLSIQDKNIITVQESPFSHNGPGPLPPGLKDGISKYPVIFVPKKNVESKILKKYQIRLQFNETPAMYRLDKIIIPGFGYFAQIKEDDPVKSIDNAIR